VMDGMIMDDNDDFRPGLKARDEEGVLSPLQAVELYKSEIREFAKAMKLPIWGKPASCSVASRFPYYSEITEEKIKKVMEGEQFLNSLGFSVVRLRYHDSIARIEVEEDRLADLLENRVIINQYLKELGFEYVALDVSGYQMGRMNEELLEANAI
ncbi:MAG: lactate racemization operon protein LarE, partial [Oscillospiraceae bacterium]